MRTEFLHYECEFNLQDHAQVRYYTIIVLVEKPTANDYIIIMIARVKLSSIRFEGLLAIANTESNNSKPHSLHVLKGRTIQTLFIRMPVGLIFIVNRGTYLEL